MVKQHSDYVTPRILEVIILEKPELMTGSNYPNSSTEGYNIDDENIFGE